MTEETFELIMAEEPSIGTNQETNRFKIDFDSPDPIESRLHSLCLQILAMREQISDRLWSVIKIPIAPATLFAGLVAVLADRKIVPQDFANFFYGLDILLTTLKTLAVVLARSEALVELKDKHREISRILDTSDSADILRYLAILDSHGIYSEDASFSSVPSPDILALEQL